jgi:hypothetical protein
MAESNKQEKKNLVKDNPIDKRAARVAKRTAKKTARVSKRTVKKAVREVKREVKKADRTKKKETRVDARTKRKIDRKTTSASKAAGDMGDAKSGSRKETRKYSKMVKKVGQREKLEATKSGKRVAAASKKKKNY